MLMVHQVVAGMLEDVVKRFLMGVLHLGSGFRNSAHCLSRPCTRWLWADHKLGTLVLRLW